MKSHKGIPMSVIQKCFITLADTLKTLSFLLFIFTSVVSSAQTQDDLYKQALKLKGEFKYDEALTIFQQLLKADSSRIEYLTNASFLYSKLGNRQKAEADRQKYFQKSEYLAKKAISINPNNAEGHYTYALAIARQNEYASTKTKIANAKLIRTECDLALKANPKHTGALHILGRWHRSIAGFNFIERGMINTFFGGVPQGGSYQDAIDCFSKAVKLEPIYMLHKYELAVTYYERGEGDDYILCKIWCKKVLEMKPMDQDDVLTQQKARDLLKKVE
jgi:tetratricopeptide (TPR) repeat protein